MNRLKLYAGDALLRIAGVCARAGRGLLGKPVTRLAHRYEKGARILTLDAAPPAGIVKALRLVGATVDEVVKVDGIQGRVVVIDRPTGQSYERGAAVKVLI